MPNPRRLGATKTPFVEEYTTRSPTPISPARGRSSPAIERSVVVLPQPLGPSRVKSFPSGTSKLTSCAARTISPRSLGYSVNNPSTFSTPLSLLHAEFLPQPLGDHHVDPARDKPGLQERQDDAAKRRAPGGPAHRRRFLQFFVDLQHRSGVVAQPVGHETGDVGDEHDPDRPVDADIEVEIKNNDRKAENEARKHHRQRSDVVQ